MDIMRENSPLKKGVMKMLSDKPFWWVIPSIINIAIAIAVFAALEIKYGRTLFALFVFIILDIPAELMLLFARTGTRCEYEADDEKLTLRRKNKPEECYYYSEMKNVEMSPLYMLWLKCGYKVVIETKYRRIVRYYAFDGPYDKTLPQDTPFAILSERIPRES